MSSATAQPQKKLVLLGGGHAHVAVLKAFGQRPLANTRLVLVSPYDDTPYSGMLPGMIAGHYSRDEIHLDLPPLSAFARADFIRGRAVGLDLSTRQIQLENGEPVAFDVLSIDTGSTPTRAGIPGAVDFAIAVKPIHQLLHRLPELDEQFLRHRETPLHLVTVGGGAGGVELTLSLQHRLRASANRNGLPDKLLQCTIITGSTNILPGHHRRVVARFEAILRQRGIRVLTNDPAVKVQPSRVVCESGRETAYDTLFWTTNAAAPEWPAQAGLATDANGFIAVNSFLQSTSHDFVFAAGDVATLVKNPCPKSGVYAVRQGPPLARNLRAVLRGLPMESYHPQRLSLNLISTGNRQAVASRGGICVSGGWVWYLKRFIDQKWMRGYRKIAD